MGGTITYKRPVLVSKKEEKAKTKFRPWLNPHRSKNSMTPTQSLNGSPFTPKKNKNQRNGNSLHTFNFIRHEAKSRAIAFHDTLN